MMKNIRNDDSILVNLSQLTGATGSLGPTGPTGPAGPTGPNPITYNFSSYNINWHGGVTGSARIDVERTGNILHITTWPISNQTQVADHIYSDPLPAFAWPNTQQLTQCLVINSASYSGYQIGSAILNTNGTLYFGLGLNANTSTGLFAVQAYFSNGQTTGYGNGLVQQTLAFDLN